MPSAAEEKRPRLTNKDWELAALEAIAETGELSAVSVEPLARRLKVTKGSFYWHFQNGEELLKAVLLRWERVFTQLKFHRLGDIPDPRQRLEQLFQEATTDTQAQAVFLAVTASGQHPLVKPVLDRVTTFRVGFLKDSLVALGVDKREAYFRALLLYSAYVGLIHLLRQNTDMA